MCRSILIQSSSGVFMILVDNLNPCLLYFDYDYQPSPRLRPGRRAGVRARVRRIHVETCQRFPSAESFVSLDARVVEWQTRTFEGRMPKGLLVHVPPRAFPFLPLETTLFGPPSPIFRTDLGHNY